MSNPVRWFELYVSDLERATRFYESMLGIQLQKLDAPSPDLQMMSFPSMQEGYGTTGALVHMPGVEPKPGGTLIYFGCEDCALQAARAEAAGGRIERPKMSIGPYGHIALVMDTEGNMIGLHSMQ